MATKNFPYTEDPSKIPTKKVLVVAGESVGTVYYACPRRLWDEHLAGWRRALREGRRNAPAPMPVGHLMFSKSTSYGSVKYGSTDRDELRRAIENSVRSDLHGWDRFLTDKFPPAEAKQRLDAIVKATVDAKMAGKDTGAAHFLACVFSGI